MQTKNIDYSTALYFFQGYRKHFFRDRKYFIHVFVDEMVMGEKLGDQNPKYIIKFSLAQQIGWIIDFKADKGLILKAFTYSRDSVLKEFCAEHDHLANLKLLLSNKLTFYKISDFYSPQYVIGKGSSAIVLLANSIADKNNYAIKSIDKSYLKKTDDGMESFQSEVDIIKILSRYNSEKIKYFLSLYEIFEGEQTFYLVVDLMEGKSLQAELESIKRNEKGQMKLSSVKTIMRTLLQGVQIMHDEGIIHRDLKPDNIMFAKQDDYTSVRIVDFGLATRSDVEFYQFPKCGTPGYAAPEILNLKNRKEKYSSVCDIFSVGCIFYKLLTGQSLFQGVEFQEVLRLNKDCKIDFLSKEFREIPASALQLLQWMLQKDPSRRITAELAVMHEFLSPEQSQQSTKPALKEIKLLYSDVDDPQFTKMKQININIQKRIILNENSHIFSPFIREANDKKFCKQDIMLKNTRMEELEDSDKDFQPEKYFTDVTEQQYLKDKLQSLDRLFIVNDSDLKYKSKIQGIKSEEVSTYNMKDHLSGMTAVNRDIEFQQQLSDSDTPIMTPRNNSAQMTKISLFHKTRSQQIQ